MLLLWECIYDGSSVLLYHIPPPSPTTNTTIPTHPGLEINFLAYLPNYCWREKIHPSCIFNRAESLPKSNVPLFWPVADVNFQP